MNLSDWLGDHAWALWLSLALILAVAEVVSLDLVLIMLAVGVVAGLVMGLIPGLGGTGAVAILLPVTFGMEPGQALALLIGALAVVHTSDTVSAVLLGAPGSASAAQAPSKAVPAAAPQSSRKRRRDSLDGWVR